MNFFYKLVHRDAFWRLKSFWIKKKTFHAFLKYSQITAHPKYPFWKWELIPSSQLKTTQKILTQKRHKIAISMWIQFSHTSLYCSFTDNRFESWIYFVDVKNIHVYVWWKIDNWEKWTSIEFSTIHSHLFWHACVCVNLSPSVASSLSRFHFLIVCLANRLDTIIAFVMFVN